MLGILILAVVSMWIWIGRDKSLLFKAALSVLIVASYVFFLRSQGATQDEIWEILLSVDF